MIILEWDSAYVANALRVPSYLAERLLRDGRLLQPLIEARISAEWPGVSVELSSYGSLLKGRDHKLHKVRCLTARGISFTPSGQRGKGRYFNAAEWMVYLGLIDVFLVPETESFPYVKIHEIAAEEVLALCASDAITNGFMPKAHFLSYIKERDNE